MMAPENDVVGSIRLLSQLLEAQLPAEEFILVNSVWLALMGIRENGDLDLLVSTKLWRERFSEHSTQTSFGIPGPYERWIRVHSIDNGPYAGLEGVVDNDDVIYSHRIEIGGIPLVEPRLYFRYKLERLSKTTSQVKSIPWWRRNRFLVGDARKALLKRNKDARDFKSLRRFFNSREESLGSLALVGDSQWGKNDPSLSFLFP